MRHPVHKETVHLGIKYDCDLCKFSGTQSNLLAHKRQQHGGIYPNKEKWKCKVCGKYCVNAGKLKKHIESHNQKICDLFGKTFKNIGAHIAGGRMCKKYAKL